MAWSVKIQSGTGGTQGYNEWQAVYDAASQTALKLKYGFSLGNQAPDVLFHTPDNGAPIPVRANGANRLLFLTVDIPASATWDSITGLVNTLARLVDGPNSQAVRAQTAGDVDKVRVAIKPNGATYTTYFEVLTGFMDTSTAFTEPEAVLNVLGRNVTLALTCKPYGYGDTITLANGLGSSPHFVEDSDADGLADGWTKSGTPTCTIDTTNYLTGGKSQKIVASANGYGVVSGNVSCVDSAGGSIWVYITTGTVFVRTYNVTDTATLTSKTVNASTVAAASVANRKGPGGATWYKLDLSGTFSGTKNIRLEAVASGGAATFYLDNAYLQSGITASPKAWSSAYTLTNNALNYLDVWGVPGDAPALIDMSLSPSGTNRSAFVFGRRTDGKWKSSVIRYRIDSAIFSGGAFSVSSNYIRATTTGSSGDYFASADNIIPADDGTATARAIGDTLFKLYVVARASNAANTLTAAYGPTGSTISAGTASPVTVDTWELWDMGTINPLDLVVNNSGTSSFYLGFDVTISSGSLDIDYALLVPAGEELLVVEGTPSIIYGTLQKMFYSVGFTARWLQTWGGSLWSVSSGNVTTRIVYHDYGTNRAVTAGNTLALSLTVTPRTSHLLGVG